MKKITLILLVFALSTIVHAQNTNKVVVKGNGSQQHSYRTSNGLTSTNIEYDGTIVFNETDTDVESISRGGFLKISKRTFGTRRTVLLEGKSNGANLSQLSWNSLECLLDWLSIREAR